MSAPESSALPASAVVNLFKGTLLLMLFQERGQGTDGGGLKETHYGQVNSQGFAEFCLRLYHQQRMAAEIKKVIVPSHLHHAQQLLPYFRNGTLGFSARCGRSFFHF